MEERETKTHGTYIGVVYRDIGVVVDFFLRGGGSVFPSSLFPFFSTF
jgi:hypothetical protein